MTPEPATLTTLEDALALFIDFKRGELLKEGTINGYTYVIGLFVQSLPEDRRTVDRVRASDIARFLSAQRDQGIAPTTVKVRYTTLATFFNWCEGCQEIGHPPSPIGHGQRKAVKPPKVPKKEPRRARLEDVHRLIESIRQSSWIDLRDRAMVQLLLDTGLRVGELANLSVADVDITERLVAVRSGKRDKDRYVPFTQASALAVPAYLLSRPYGSVDILFCSNRRSRMTSRGIWRVLDRRCKSAGVQHINPHSIRHLFGLKALNDGMPLEVVSKLMGHESPDFTERVYAPYLTSTIQRIYDQFWK